jgi:hypothetical protein
MSRSVGQVVADERFAARAGDAAAIASYIALRKLGRPRQGLRVVSALAVRRHVRDALRQFSDEQVKRRRHRALLGLSLAAAAIAVGGSRRRRGAP